jgi:predicted DNA-binding WGR domain protein
LASLEQRATDAGLRNIVWDAFVCENDTSSKFWRIRRAHVFMETWWGRIGTNGQTKIKEYGSALTCAHAFGKIKVEKANKGYVRDRTFELRALIAAGGGRDRVMSTRGTDLGEIVVNRIEVPAENRRPGENRAELRYVVSETVFGVTPPVRAAQPAPPQPVTPPRKPETVPLGRFAGLGDDEEEEI